MCVGQCPQGKGSLLVVCKFALLALSGRASTLPSGAEPLLHAGPETDQHSVLYPPLALACHRPACLPGQLFDFILVCLFANRATGEQHCPRKGWLYYSKVPSSPFDHANL